MRLIKMFVESAREKAIQAGIEADSKEEKRFMRRHVDKRIKRVFD